MRRPMFTSHPGGRPVRFLASGVIGAVLIATLGAAASPQARLGVVTNDDFELNAVSVLSAANAWAVGGSATVLHWNGTAWAPVTTAGPAHTDLYAVDALSSSDIWAAGLTNTLVSKTVIEHWNGSTWTRTASPGSFDTNNLIPALSSLSMDSATDGWAVGQVYSKNKNASTPLALHWNGVTWQQVTASSASSFTGVASFSPTDATAVGGVQTSGGGVEPAAFDWNGTTWALAQALPPLSGGSAAELAGPYGLSAASAADLWTVGGQFTSSAIKNLAWHWNGTRWTRSQVLVTPSGSGLTGEAATSPSNVWAVGYTIGGSVRTPLSAHWNGTGWTQVTTPDPGGSSQDTVLNAVGAAGSGNVWAVGYYSTGQIPHTLILHWNGTGWVQS
jgi:hypothetical protein